MAGSPRVERAARIRLENPNLSTEEAMKLAGYSEEEAKDQKRQSNVRQKTHRLSKGRNKRPADTELINPEPSKRMSYPPSIGMHHDNIYQQHGRRTLPLHMPEQGMMHDYSRMPPIDMPFSSQQQSARMPMDNMSIPHQQQQQHQQQHHQQQHHQQPMRYTSVENVMPMVHQQQQQHQQQGMQQQQHQQGIPLQHQPQHLQQQQLQQQQLQQQQPHIPYNTPARAARGSKTETTSAKSPGGSPRVERAAKLRLKDPTVSTEEAMKLAGFTAEEAKDKKKQNNVRQKTHRMSLKQAPKSSQKASQQDISSLIKEEIGKLEGKVGELVQSFEQRIENKFKELGDRIDQRFTDVLNILQIQSSGDVAEQKRGLEPRSPPKDPDSNDDILDSVQL